MEIKNGGQAAAKALAQQGVDLIFTLCGGHLNQIFFNLEEAGVRFFDTRHEQAAVWMAEAYGRLTRRPGVAMVTAGPGFTNALTPIASAWMAATPLVLISGAVGINMIEKMDLQDIRQQPIIESMVKKAIVCHHPERIPEMIDLAFRHASSGRPGPVYLELPVDVLGAAPREDKPVVFPKTRPVSRTVDREKAREILDTIEAAEKPILVVGSGGWYSDAGDELTRLIEQTGLPLFTQSNGRGVVSDDHRYCFGGISAIRPGAGLHACWSTDLIVLLGTRLNLFTLFGDIFNPEAKFIQVDVEPEEIGRNKSIHLPVVGDIKATAAEMIEIAAQDGRADRIKSQFSGWIDELSQADADGKATAREQWDSDHTPIHPMRLCKEIDAFLDRPDDILITDGGDTTTWMGMTRRFQKPGRYLDYGIFGCLGGGIPYANTAKTLYPDQRVGLIIGDGSMGFNFMELERSLSQNVPFVVIINNDLGWGMIRHSQEVRLGRAMNELTDLGRIDYHRMVEAMGGAGFLVEQPADIRPALEAAFNAGRLACVNVMTDPTTVSPGSIALANVGAYK